MSAKEKFKNKAEVAAELDKLGIEYKKVESGANAGKPTETFDALCAKYDAASVSAKPVFHRPLRGSRNPFTNGFKK